MVDEEEIVSPEEESKINKYASDVEEDEQERGKKVFIEIIRDMERQAEESGIKPFNFDTDIIIDEKFDTIKLVNGKVVFGEGHDLDWALDNTPPMQLLNSLQLAQRLVSSFIQVSKMPTERDTALSSIGRLMG